MMNFNTKEMKEMATKTLQMVLESEVSELNAKIAKKAFEAYKTEGFNDEQAFQLTLAVMKK